jgi:hypothetical protein
MGTFGDRIDRGQSASPWMPDGHSSLSDFLLLILISPPRRRRGQVGVG